MGFFSRIMDKLRHHSGDGARQQTANSDPNVAQQTAGETSSGRSASGNASYQQGQGATAPPNASFQQSAQQQDPQVQSLQNVDVDAVLTRLAQQKGGGGNYRTSIVDLLKLLDLDASLDARKELAQELGVNAGAHGSAEQNIALQKAVMRKLAENGGRVPDSLRH